MIRPGLFSSALSSLLGLFVLTACDPQAESCTPPTARGCTCNSAQGTQICLSSGEWGFCDCDRPFRKDAGVTLDAAAEDVLGSDGALADGEVRTDTQRVDSRVIWDAAVGADGALPDTEGTVDGGVNRDTGSFPDGFFPDTAVYPDTTVYPDTAVYPDTRVNPDTGVNPDTTVYPDTRVNPDTRVHPDAWSPDVWAPDRWSPDTHVASFALLVPSGRLTPENPAPGLFPGLVGVLNVDDDDGNGTADYNEETSPTQDNDQVLVTVEAAGHTLDFAMEGASSDIKMRYQNRVVLGDGSSNSWRAPRTDTFEVAFEFGFVSMAQGRLTVTSQSGGQVQLRLTASPLVLNHHLQVTEQVWVVAINQIGWDNIPLQNGLSAALGNRYHAAAGSSYEDDPWMQDEVEFTAFNAPGQRLEVVIDSIRDQGLDPFPEEQLVEPDVASFTFGSYLDATTYDSFGNLEVTPPLDVNGVDYPLGRIYYGKHNTVGLDSVLADFLAHQSVQAPIEIDTTWLVVGHVDEFMTFVPDATAPRGFRLLYADTEVGYGLLDAMNEATSLPQYAPAAGSGGHGIANVGEMANNTALRSYNQGLQLNHLNPILAQLRSELGLQQGEVIFVPAIFEELVEYGYSGAVALIPGMVNLLLVHNQDGTSLAFIADPFMRSNPGNQSGDPYIQYWNNVMPAGIDLHYLDNWDVYHLGLGEIHCATNSRRSAGVPWWTQATHLVEEEAF